MRGAARMTTSLQAREQALSVIEMRREGMSTVTIAAATGLSESTVRRRTADLIARIPAVRAAALGAEHDA